MQVAKIVMLVLMIQGSACVSLDGERAGVHESVIQEDTPLEEALPAGTAAGGAELARLQRLINSRREWPQAHAWLENYILLSTEKNPNQGLENVIHLYLNAPPKPSRAVFAKLINNRSREITRLGWLLAVSRPRTEFRKIAEAELTASIESGLETKHLCGEMARAVRALRVEGFYSLLRLGLMLDGHPAFADGMIAEDPKAAAEDFLTYISIANLEELRQLTLTSLQLPTCLVVMRHLSREKPDLTHPNFNHLFNFTAARIIALAELANMAIETHLPDHAQQLALILSRQPVLVQEAYIEGLRERLNANLRLFLTVFRNVTAREDIAGHISELVDG